MCESLKTKKPPASTFQSHCPPAKEMGLDFDCAVIQDGDLSAELWPDA